MKNKEEPKETRLIKDRDCISCKKMFDCKGKPYGVLCVRKEERGKTNDMEISSMWDNDPDNEEW